MPPFSSEFFCVKCKEKKRAVCIKKKSNETLLSFCLFADQSKPFHHNKRHCRMNCKHTRNPKSFFSMNWCVNNNTWLESISPEMNVGNLSLPIWKDWNSVQQSTSSSRSIPVALFFPRVSCTRRRLPRILPRVSRVVAFCHCCVVSVWRMP